MGKHVHWLFYPRCLSDASLALVFALVAIFLAGLRLPAEMKNDDEGNDDADEAAVNHVIK